MHKIFCYQCYLSCIAIISLLWLLDPSVHSKPLDPGYVVFGKVDLNKSRGVGHRSCSLVFVWHLGLLAFAAVLVTSSRPSAIRWPRKRFLSWSVSAADGAGGIRCREGFTCRLCGCKTSCLLDLAGRLVYGLHDCRLASDQEERPVGRSVFLRCGVTDDCLF